MPDKLEFTRKLTAQYDTWSAEDAMEHWWQNRHAGWRLTHNGFQAFEQYGLEHWDFETEVAIHAVPRILLVMDRKLTAPYYIKLGKRPKLCFFSSTEATMYAMYNNLEKFLRYLNHT